MMPNSLTLFAAFLAFLTFGYLSLVRILYQQHFNAPFSALFAGLKGSQGLRYIGSSTFFVSLPATSLLLFWGWGPALLWLAVFHLLADSLVNLQVTSVDHQAGLSEYLMTSDGSPMSHMMRGLLQFYLVLLLAVVLTLLTQLIDKESGLLFALIGLIPAYLLWHNKNTSIPKRLKQVGALGLLLVGLIFASKLGVAIYGDWALLGEWSDWLRFNNKTIIAAILLISSAMLANNEAFSDGVTKLAGAVIIVAIILLTVKLIWLRPILDAPLNSIQLHGIAQGVDELPLFISICMFLFAGLSTLFFRVFNSTAPSDTQWPPAAEFGRVQVESLLQLLLATLLVLCLASGLGIGAWKTHYLDWSAQTDFVGHLNLAIASLSHLIYSDASGDNFVHTAIMAGLCVAGLSFLQVCVRALSLAHDTKLLRVGESGSFLQTLIQSKLLQLVTAFFATSYFIKNGISLDIWLLLGILSWIIVMQLITSMTVTMTQASFARLVYGSQCLILIVLGSMQTLWVAMRWATHQEYIYAAIGFGLLAIGVYLWRAAVREIITRFAKIENKSLFD